MAFIKRVRSYFFSTVGDTKVNGFWTRFINGSRPQQNTFEELTASVPFFAEQSSAAATDNLGALSEKQGLVVIATPEQAKANDNYVKGGTGGALVVSPSHLPNVVEDTTEVEIRDFEGIPLEVNVDDSGDNNAYSVTLNEDLVTTLNNYLLPDLTGATPGQVPVVNAGGTAYELGAGGGGGTGGKYKTFSTSSTDFSAITIGTGGVFGLEVESGLDYTVNQRVYIVDDNDPTNYIYAIVQSYSGTTLTVMPDAKGGTGTSAELSVNLSKEPLPLHANVTTKSSLKVENGIYFLEEDPIITTSLQFWIAPNGDDTTGDGSNGKPWATFSKARTEILGIADTTGANVTLIVVGGAYSNNVNMAIQKTAATYYNYTIFCFPGVTITQTGLPWYDNSAIAGHVDVYGSPSITTSDSLTGGYLLRMATKRVPGTNAQTVQTHQYSNIISTGAVTKPVYIGSASNGASGISFAYLKAKLVFAAQTTPAILVQGEDTAAAISISAVTTDVSSGVTLELDSAGAVSVLDTRFSSQDLGQGFTAIKVTSAAEFNSTWLAGTSGKGQNPGYFISNCYGYSRNATDAVVNSTFLDITGAGDLSTSTLVDSCKHQVGYGANSSGCFLRGASSSDIATIRLCTSSDDGTANGIIGGAIANPVGSDPTITVEDNNAFFIVPISGV